jgi:hypothetical protein
LAVNVNEEMVMRATRAIRHDDRSADRLLMRENILCIFPIVFVARRYRKLICIYLLPKLPAQVP